MVLKTSQCGSVMHKVRNSLLGIQLIVLDLDDDDPHIKQLNNEVQKITDAISLCDKYKSGCGGCNNAIMG